MQSRQLCDLPTDCDGPGKDKNIKALTILLCTKKVVSNRHFIAYTRSSGFCSQEILLSTWWTSEVFLGGKMFEESQNIEVLEEIKIMIVSINLI